MRLKLALIVILSLPGSLWAVPAITTATWSGSLDHGTVVTVTGTGFTTKGTAAPLVYDTFDSGRFDSYWSSTNDLGIATTNDRNVNSTRAAYLNFVSGSDDGNLTGENTSYEKWFVSIWVYFHTNYDWGTSGFGGTDKWLSNLKFPFRMWDAGSTTENYFFQYDGQADTLKIQRENIPTTFSSTIYSSFRSTFDRGEWHQFEAILDDSSLATADGTIQLWQDGNIIYDQTSIKTRESDSVFKRFNAIGAKNSWSPGEATPDTEGDQDPNEFWMDDVYVDNSWHGVFITTSSTYAADGFREYSAPSSWSTTSIDITFHEGSFIVGTDTVYLYVRDSAGLVNSSGLQLEGSGGEPPSPPSSSSLEACPCYTGN